MEDPVLWFAPALILAIVAVFALHSVKHRRIGAQMPGLLCEAGWTALQSSVFPGYLSSGIWEGKRAEAEYLLRSRDNPTALVLRVEAPTPGVFRLKRTGRYPINIMFADLFAPAPIVKQEDSTLLLRGAPATFALACLEALPKELLNAGLEQPYDEIRAEHGSLEFRKELRNLGSPFSALSPTLPHPGLRQAILLGHRILSVISASSVSAPTPKASAGPA